MKTSNWSQLGFSKDPLPGDPDGLRRANSKYSAVAESVRESAASLRAATKTTTTLSLAVAEFTRLAVEVAEAMDKIEDRYDVVARQLGSYAPQVESAQSRGEQLVAFAISARAAAEKHMANARYIETQLNDASTPPESRLALERAKSQEWSRHADNDASFYRLKDQVEQLSADLDAIAMSASKIIRSVIDDSELNDSWWDKLTDFVLSVAEWIVDNIDIFIQVLDFLSILLTVIAFVLVFTGVGAPISAALFAIARACQAVSKVLKIVKVAATVLLVVAGRRPVTDLVAIAIDYAVGKVIDGAVGKIADKYAPILLDRLDPEGLLIEGTALNITDADIDLILDEYPMDFVPDLDVVFGGDSNLTTYMAGYLVESAVSEQVSTLLSAGIGGAMDMHGIDIGGWGAPIVTDAVGGAVEAVSNVAEVVSNIPSGIGQPLTGPNIR